MKITERNGNLTAIGGESPTNDGRDAIETQKPYRVAVRIEGVCPILFHRWSNEAVDAKARAKKGSAGKKADNTESFLWRNNDGEICIPGEYLRQSIIQAAKFEQDPRSPRKSMLDLAKAAIVSLTDMASLGVKVPDFYDKRRVTIQRASVTRTRPAMDTGWKAEFFIMVNLPEYIPSERLNQLIQSAGRIIGVGDFRPSFGRFSVVKFELLDD